MKVLFDHPRPFFLSHGGFQIQIEETKRALEAIGVDVEFVRWWDQDQHGDIMHYFGRPFGIDIQLAHQKGIRVVMSDLLTGLGSRPATGITMQKLAIRLVEALSPAAYREKMGWDSYKTADRIIALTSWEAELMVTVFGAPQDRVVVLPNGVADEFLASGPGNSKRGEFLVCTATITERKRVLELAEAAFRAKTPLWVIGKPYSESDEYARGFFSFAEQHSSFIRYQGSIDDRRKLADIYRRARGFVLLSKMESLSLSVLEAAACGCPVLLSDLPWARKVFGDSALYCPPKVNSRSVAIIRNFYDSAPELKAPPMPVGWRDVAERLKRIYEQALSNSL